MKINDKRSAGLVTEAEQRSQDHGFSTFAAPSEFMLDFFGGTTTSSDIRVTAKIAMQLSDIYTCIRILSQSIAQLPFNVRRRLDRGSEVARDNPIQRIVSVSPNKRMTPFVYRQARTAHIGLWGASYSEIVFGRNGRAESLKMLMPTLVHEQTVAGDDGYRVTDDKGQTYNLEYDEVLHVPGMTIDGRCGLAPCDTHKETIAAGIVARDFSAKLMAKGFLNGYLKHPTKVKGPDRADLLATWNSNYRSMQGEGQGTALLEHGLEFVPISTKSADAEVAVTRKGISNQIAAIYGVPAHMLGDTAKDTYGNREQSTLDFVIYGLMPYAIQVEQEYARKLLTDREQGEYFFRHSFEGLLRGDSASRAEKYRKGILDGYMTRNEARELEDLPVNDTRLDAYLQPLNMVQVGVEPDATGAPAPNDSRSLDALKPIIADKLKVMRSRELNALKSAGDAVTDRVVNLHGQLDGVVRQLFEPVADSMAAISGKDHQREFMDMARSVLSRDMQESYSAVVDVSDIVEVATLRSESLDDICSQLLARASVCFEVTP